MKSWAALIYFRCRVLDYRSRLKRLEALFYGSCALRCSYSWKRTHDAIMKGYDEASDVEECQTACEAEFMSQWASWMKHGGVFGSGAGWVF